MDYTQRPGITVDESKAPTKGASVPTDPVNVYYKHDNKWNLKKGLLGEYEYKPAGLPAAYFRKRHQDYLAGGPARKLMVGDLQTFLEEAEPVEAVIVPADREKENADRFKSRMFAFILACANRLRDEPFCKLFACGMRWMWAKVGPERILEACCIGLLDKVMEILGRENVTAQDLLEIPTLTLEDADLLLEWGVYLDIVWDPTETPPCSRCQRVSHAFLPASESTSRVSRTRTVECHRTASKLCRKQAGDQELVTSAWLPLLTFHSLLQIPSSSPAGIPTAMNAFWPSSNRPPVMAMSKRAAWTVARCSRVTLPNPPWNRLVRVRARSRA